MAYFAEVHPTEHTVIRVVVADTIEWCQDDIPGQVQTDVVDDMPVFTPTYWLETADPYTAPGTLAYCGPGFGADPAVPERFALPWSVEAATIPNEMGEYAYATQGQTVFHNGKIWRNLNPDGNPNVWEPGIANWREYPMGAEHPIWIQPVGSVDSYPLDFIVEHNGKAWKNVTPDNVWAPGTGELWEDLTPAPPISEWTQPTGAHNAYNIGDRVLFNQVVYESLINSNVWSPTAYPAGWTVVL